MVFDILELIINKKNKILLFSLILFALLSSTSIFKSEGKLRGTITIFPTNEIETINQLNTFTKLVGEKKLEILGSKEISAVINTDAIEI